MSDSHTITVLGLTGSFRKAGYNRNALLAAIELAPPGMRIEAYDYRDIPFYDGDLEAESGIPATVEKLNAKIRAADAVLIVTPEYNTSLPGLLKNALDWTSRASPQPLRGKPIAIMGASSGTYGTIRSQTQLREVLRNTGGQVMAAPQVTITNSAQRFGVEGRLTDEDTRQHIGKLLAGLVDWVRQIRK